MSTDRTDRNHAPAAGPATIVRNAYAVYQPLAMLAGMELDVFTPLKDGPMGAEVLAESIGVGPAVLAPLLYALVTAGLLVVEDGLFSNTGESQTYLVRGRTEYMGGLHGFYRKLWQAALHTAESIRTGKPQAKLDWMSLPEDQLVGFFKSQYPGSLRAGRHLAEKIDFGGFNCLLDAGGGSGGLSIGICESHPHLKGTVVDLPAVVPISGRFIRDAGMSGRISFQAADLTESPPEGAYDVAVLRALIQVMSPRDAARVLANVSRVIEPGGVLHIVGNVLEDTRLSPPAAIAFSLVSLNVYDEGRAYTEGEYRDWLTHAGFTDISVEHNAMSDGLAIVSARRAH